MSETSAEAFFRKRLRALCERDDSTNLWYLARVYLVFLLSIGGAVWVFEAVRVGHWSPWLVPPVYLLAVLAIGASQHQLGGATHEATHLTLFRNRRLNERVSDWLCMFPLYSSTFEFRLHHLAHHHYVNDPERDPDFGQLRASGHWLDFPIDRAAFRRFLMSQIWLPNLVRYTLARARYNALGAYENVYAARGVTRSSVPRYLGVAFALGAPVVLEVTRHVAGLAWGLGLLAALTAATVAAFFRLPEAAFSNSRMRPVVGHRATAVSRILFMALLYGALSATQAAMGAPAWGYFLLLWVVPLFTSFALFMMLRQLVQHGNADRGRLTNTRVFLMGPLVRYAVFPFGMDYHLPHHLYPAVPHYRLRELHALLLDSEPAYRERAVVVEGYFRAPRHAAVRNPTVADVVGPGWAPTGGERPFVDERVVGDLVAAGVRPEDGVY
jgi:fatty acid desaturase